jgi:hypothetical protein
MAASVEPALVNQAARRDRTRDGGDRGPSGVPFMTGEIVEVVGGRSAGQ